MKRLVELLPEAEREVESAFFWYEHQKRGLGLEFVLAFDAAIERIRRLPEGHEIVALRTRRILLRRFPYLVLYTLEESRIVVMAVFHGRRDPRAWSERVREGWDSAGFKEHTALALTS